MSELSIAPDLSALEIPMDAWTQPFWDASARSQLLLPRCVACQHFRWPPGPFCPHCQSQQTEWLPAGSARIYSFTLTPEPRSSETDSQRYRAPALIEFPEADGIRLLAAIVDTPIAAIQIGAPLQLGWSQAANARVPVFSVAR
jgi:hypothetical protein